MSRTTTQPHPLAPYADQIDPAEVYTVRRVAALLGMALTSVSGLVNHGFLPGSRLRPHARGGRQHVWTGKQLLRIAQRPVRVNYDHEKFAAVTLYRVGCRCPACVQAHSAESLERRRALAEKAFTAEQRNRVLELVAAQTPVPVAAQEVGVTLHQVYGRANWDLDFAEAFDEAGWSLCVLGQEHPKCSTPSGYRGNEGGTAGRPPCRGTGCREWRRGTSQQERAAA
ncbi:hypothetical protein [Streptomyces violascens]|uniref:hypothetical protein n=1 Tax=Streptomyces violascens TaxID=67381 RepID=UPI00167B3D22|nr:hypothetical protein [Streptomyces violascens]GGU39263.1 hypothetical protein GCM10010289_70230 [Streptomyces violascens]